MLYLLSALSVMYILLMYYISLLLLPPDGFVLCYIGFLVLTLWRFDDNVISPSPGKGRYRGTDDCIPQDHNKIRFKLPRCSFGQFQHFADICGLLVICRGIELPN